jgi:hypothetical protein
MTTSAIAISAGMKFWLFIHVSTNAMATTETMPTNIARLMAVNALRPA